MIRIENLTKYYGSVRAVNRINFQVGEGEILGFLGPNGAGKSTTLKILTCFLTPTDGNIFIDQYNIYEHSKEIRELIGYLPENNPLYLDMAVYDYLLFIGELRGLNQKAFNKSLRNVIDKCGLTGVVSKPIHTLSKGYRQRVGLAQAILHDPKILILDEPTAGLDPNQIIEIRDLIKELGKEKTLILSSHILQEVQAVCSRIVIINKGDIVADGTLDDLKASLQGKNRLNLDLVADDFDAQLLKASIPELDIVNITPKEGFLSLVLEYSSDRDLRSDIYNYIKKKDWVILEMHREFMSLEDLFRTLTIEKEVA
ncbi:MAG: ATP-binding cassette domain-containing protein [Candidatus Cloacimonetes bacterium]|nr:ATP-binding cassette domain-containing protein [Candidatus Cloacimonadota bacterium]